MKTSLKLFPFITVLLSFTNSFSQNSGLNPVHATIQDEQGFLWIGTANIPVNSIVQDARNFLWIATANGLYRYDGLEYKSYHHEPSDSNSLSLDIVEGLYAGKDYLLIGTHGAGMDCLNLLTGVFTHYRLNTSDLSSISNDTVTSIVKDKQGIIWVGTYNGLNKFNPATGKFTRYKNNPHDTASISDNQVWVLFVDDEGTLWAGTKSPWAHDGGSRVGGLNRFMPKTDNFLRYMHYANNAQSISDNCITAIFQDTRKNLWIGTAGDGLQIMNRNTGSCKQFYYQTNNKTGVQSPSKNFTVPGDNISFINEDAEGNIWSGTLLNGLNKYNPLTQKTEYAGTQFSSRDSIIDNQFSASFKARDGVLWIGAWSGNLYKINPGTSPLQDKHIGMTALDFCKDANGILWLATARGLVKMYKDGSTQQFLPDKDAFSPTNNFTAIKEDNAHTFWLGSISAGLYRFNPSTNSFTHYQHTENVNSLLNDRVLSLAKTNNNKLWIGTANGLDLFDISSGAFTHYAHKPNDSTSMGASNFNDVNAGVYSVIESTNDTAWLCVNNAVNRLNKNAHGFKRYIFPVYTNDIIEASNGDVWVATDAGLYKYDKNADKFFLFHDASGVIKANTGIYKITEDKDENLWLRISGGFIKLNAVKNEASVYKYESDKSGSPIWKSYMESDGKIFSGTPLGYFEVDPQSFSKYAPPSIVITGFALSDTFSVNTKDSSFLRQVFQSNNIHLKYNQNIFSFEFTDVDFTGNSTKKYILYRLENYEGAWRKATAEEVARYYNIPPGKYYFRIKALGNNGIWSEKNIAIIISPPWWTVWWFEVLILFLIAAFVWAVVKYYLNLKLKAQQREFDKQNAIEKVRYKISMDIHDEISSGLTKISLLSQRVENSIQQNKMVDADLIKKINSSSKEVINNLGEIIWTVNPRHDNLQSLLAYIRNYTFNFFDSTSIQLNINFPEEIKPVTVSPEVKHNLFLVIKEALNNIIKHADASVVDITFTCSNSSYKFLIKDNGKGLHNLNVKIFGNGLTNMHNRMSVINGSINFKNEVGTTVIIEGKFV